MKTHLLGLAWLPMVVSSCDRGQAADAVEVALRVHPAAFEGTLPWTVGASGFRPAPQTPRAVRVELPRAADGAIELAAPSKPSAWLRLRPRDLSAVPAEARDKAVVYRNASNTGDVLWVAGPSSVEELRIQRVPGAIRLRYGVELGPSVHELRLQASEVQIVDEDHTVVFRAAPAFAIDARGDRVSLTPHWDGETLEWVGDGSQLVAPIVVDPSWSAAGTLASPHGFGTSATLLPSGKVLVAGGQTSLAIGSTTVAELWDPGSKTWKTAAFMSAPREGHAAFLSGGSVVVCGSVNNSTCEAYAPATDAWSPAGVLGDRRGYGALVALGAGKFLLAGGFNGSGFLSTAEIYDESTASWTSAGAISNARAYAQAVLLGGKAYVIGGRGPAGSMATVDVYDPVAKTWTAGPSMASPRDVFAAVVLSTGKLLVAGGSGASGSISFAEFFDPTASKWSAAPPKPTASDTMGLPLPGGAFVSSSGTNAIELFDTETSSWVVGPTTSVKGRVPVSLGGGSVLAVSSQLTSLGDTSAELYVSTPNGGACTKSVQCASGACVAGTCGGGDAGPPDTGPTDTGPTDTGASDAPTDAPPGTKSDGSACGGAGECASGFCVDGVCCNAACDGQCQACDLPGKIGTCGVVSGAPHGTRAKCGDSTTCAGKCDGVDTQKCVFPSAGTSCAASCEGTNAISKACDGKGSCAPVSTASCAPYVCADGLCLNRCVKNADCDVNSVCLDGVCSPVATTTGSDGGCGCAIVGRPATGAGLALLGLLAAAGRRRRRP